MPDHCPKCSTPHQWPLPVINGGLTFGWGLCCQIRLKKNPYTMSLFIKASCLYILKDLGQNMKQHLAIKHFLLFLSLEIRFERMDVLLCSIS